LRDANFGIIAVIEIIPRVLSSRWISSALEGYVLQLQQKPPDVAKASADGKLTAQNNKRAFCPSQ